MLTVIQARKRCKDCGENKALDEFSFHSGGRNARCKTCIQADGTFTCRLCGEAKPRAAFGLLCGYRDTRCRTCVATERRTKYHSDAAARARQIAYSVMSLVRRKFPDAETQMTVGEYVDVLLGAEACEYCGQPNDGTHPFNLDHRIPLALGGRHELSNLVICCEPCNRAKRDMPAEDYTAWLRGVIERGQQAG